MQAFSRQAGLCEFGGLLQCFQLHTRKMTSSAGAILHKYPSSEREVWRSCCTFG